ncbi:MAG: flavodoxin [Candidatus Promineifilaceae bacterium]
MNGKIGLFFGSNTGTTELIANICKKEVAKQAPGVTVDIHDIGLVDVTKMLEYDNLIVASPTWNIGELQDDWNLKFDSLLPLDFTGKSIAMLGVGDQFGYPDNFVDAVGILGNRLVERGGELVGFTPTYGYEFDNSLGLAEQGVMMGIAIDDVNQVDQTPHRMAEWIMVLLYDFGFKNASSLPAAA